MEIKKCLKCNNEFPATSEYFVRVKKCKNGISNECKECKRQQAKAYREENKRKICEYTKRYSLKSQEKIKAYRKKYNKKYNKRYHEKNPDYNKMYYLKNLEKCIQTNKMWYETNKESCRKRYNDRRAKKKELLSTLTLEQWQEIKVFFNFKCVYCGKEKPLEQDHFIPLSKDGEYTKTNIVPACKSCNCSKYNLDFFEWYPRQLFYNKKREQKILKFLNYDVQTKYQQIAM